MALVGSWFPVRYVPHWYGFASWAILAGIVGLIYSSRFAFGPRTKLLLGLALVANTADNEVFFNLANWATLSSFFWLLLAMADEPRSRRQSTVDILLLTLMGLNSPFVISLWPLFLMRWRVRRTRHSLILFLLSLTIVAIQVWNMISRIQKEGPLPNTGMVLIDGLIYRFGSMFLGEQVYNLHLTNPLRIYGLALIGVTYGSLLWFAIKQKNWSSLSITLGGLLAALLSLYVMRHDSGVIIRSAGRHFFIPAVTMIWALILSGIKPAAWRWIPLAMIWIAFAFLTPSHKNQIMPDLHWAEHVAQCVGTKPVCKIPINPVWDPPVWFATMSSHVFQVPEIAQPMSAQFGGQIDFLGYEKLDNSSSLDLKLVWRAAARMNENYQFFVHVFARYDLTQIGMQRDTMPLNWQYPTSKWLDREIVVDQVTLDLASLTSGNYQVGIGWYDPVAPNMPRLTAVDTTTGEIWAHNMVILPFDLVIP